MGTLIYSDKDFIDAVSQILGEPHAYASEIAEVVGCNPRYATIRLKRLVDRGILVSEKKTTGWGFRLNRLGGN